MKGEISSNRLISLDQNPIGKYGISYNRMMISEFSQWGSSITGLWSDRLQKVETVRNGAWCPEHRALSLVTWAWCPEPGALSTVPWAFHCFKLREITTPNKLHCFIIFSCHMIFHIKNLEVTQLKCMFKWSRRTKKLSPILCILIN